MLGKKITMFGDSEVGKCKFHCYKDPIFQMM